MSCRRYCVSSTLVGLKCRLISRQAEEHTSELQSPDHLVCRLLLEKKQKAGTASDTSLSLSELWDGLSCLAARTPADTTPPDLTGIALPTCLLVPVAMPASLPPTT